MKRWLAVCGLAALSSVLVVSCGGDQKYAKTPQEVIDFAKSIEAKLHMLGTHAQSAKIRGDKLENYPLFFGTIDEKGALTTDFRPQDSSVQIKGMRFEKDTWEERTVTLKPLKKDLCFPSALFPGTTLQFYSAADGAADLCPKSNFAKVEDDDVMYCPKEMTPTQKEEALTSLSGLAVAVPGAWDASGNYVDRQGLVTLSCISGVVAKCTHWGYLAAAKATIEGKSVDLKPYLQACIHAARAAYGASAASHATTSTAYTCSGTVVDIFDRLQIQPERNKYEKESYWDADGHTCMNRPRFLCAVGQSFPRDDHACDNPGNWLVGIRSSPLQEGPQNHGCPGKDEIACGDE